MYVYVYMYAHVIYLHVCACMGNVNLPGRQAGRQVAFHTHSYIYIHYTLREDLLTSEDARARAGPWISTAD
jgi:hypothetical protein